MVSNVAQTSTPFSTRRMPSQRIPNASAVLLHPVFDIALKVPLETSRIAGPNETAALWAI